jgi:hypothetical protein
MKRLILSLVSLSFICALGFGQDVIEDTYKVYGKDTIYPLRDGRFIFNEKIYKERSPYLTLAYGAGYNFLQPGVEQNMMVSYHHFIKNYGLSLGYHASSDIKVWWRSYQKLNDFWLGGGWRFERPRWNIGVFAGPSLAYGSWIAWSEERQENRAYGFTTLGGVAEMQLTYRIFYDVGLGLTLHGSYNKYYSVAGAQIHLFFSTAFVRNY